MARYESADQWFDDRSKATIEKDPSMNAVFLFDLEGAGQYTLEIVNGETTWTRGKAAEPTCTVKAKEKDFLKMASGELAAPKALMLRKVKISGNMSQALALSKFAG